MKILTEKIKDYKLVGTNLMFIPAQPIKKDLKLKVRLSNPDLFVYVKNEIQKIVSSYELQLDKDFYYGELLSKIGQIKYFDTEVQKIIEPVIYVIPNQEPFDIEINGKYYLKFNLTIEIG